MEGGSREDPPDGSGDSPGRRKLKLLCFRGLPPPRAEPPLERQKLKDG